MALAGILKHVKGGRGSEGRLDAGGQIDHVAAQERGPAVALSGQGEQAGAGVGAELVLFLLDLGPYEPRLRRLTVHG